MIQPQTSGGPGMSRTRAMVTVMTGLAATGVVIGGLWAWIAPPVHGVVALTRDGNRVRAYLGNESDHFFLAAFLMLGLLSVVAVVGPVLVWQWKAHRGPRMVVALSIGLVAAAVLSVGVGTRVLHLRYGVVDIAGAPVTMDNRVHYFTEAPPVFFGHTPAQIATSLLLPAATAALVYALFAVSTTRDDLGGYPVVDPPDGQPLAPVAPSPEAAAS